MNPVFTIGNQIAEAVRLHQGLTRARGTQEAIEMLALVGIPEPERRWTSTRTSSAAACASG